MRGSINPSKRFAVILRYYVTGDAQATISVSYRIFSLKVYRILTEKKMTFGLFWWGKVLWMFPKLKTNGEKIGSDFSA